jgi:hypothetical protein
VVMTRRFLASVRRTFTVLMVAALVVVAACSDGNDDASPASTSTTRRPTTTTAADPATAAQSEVKAAYDASSRGFIEAAAIPDPNSAALAMTHTGPMLEQRRNILRALQLDGRIIRYPANSQYRVKIDEQTFKIDGAVATFEICGVDDGERVVVATGEVIAGGVVTVEARVAMRRIDGSWRLAERQQLAEWQGVAGCAVG